MIKIGRIQQCIGNVELIIQCQSSLIHVWSIVWSTKAVALRPFVNLPNVIRSYPSPFRLISLRNAEKRPRSHSRYAEELRRSTSRYATTTLYRIYGCVLSSLERYNFSSSPTLNSKYERVVNLKSLLLRVNDFLWFKGV